MEEGDGVACPVCGQSLYWRDSIYTTYLTDRVAGCSRCLRGHNALEWYDEQDEPAKLG